MRYVASLQDEKDKTCYRDFFESETLTKAKEQADSESDKKGRPTLIFDRKHNQIVYRKTEVEKKKDLADNDEYF